jgi:ubiquinone/menaquinone biosynthesis C-methylase UbiE
MRRIPRPRGNQIVTDRKDVNEFFDQNVADYESKHYGHDARTFMTVRQRRVMELVDDLNLPKGTAVLDAGCGPGYLLEALANRGFRVSGMDGSDGMLQSAESRLRAAHPDFPFTLKQGDIEHLPFEDAQFDLVLSTGVIEYLQGDARVLREIHRVLRPDGHLVLPVTNLWSPVNAFDGIIEFLKRQAWFRRPFNLVWQRLGHGALLPRNFRVRKHRPASFRHSLTKAGFALKEDLYFHFLPFPRPFERLLPDLSTRMGEWMDEHLARSGFGILGEGYLTLSAKTAFQQSGSPRQRDPFV